MRRHSAAALFLTIVVLQAAPARSAAPGRVVVVTVDGTRLGDWRGPGLTAFDAVLDRGALGLLSTRTATTATTIPAMRREAYRALGSGLVGSVTDPTTLASALERAGVTTTVIASSVRGASSLSSRAVALPEISDGVFPTRRRTDYAAAQIAVDNALAGSKVVIVDLGDPARVEQVFGSDPTGRERWMRLSMVRADAFLAWLEGKLTPDDVLIVTSLTASVERQQARRYLSAVAITGRSTPAGSLSTPTTDQDRIVTISDLAPTILNYAGVPIPATMNGRPFRVARDDRAVEHTRDLEASFIHASVIRGPLMRWTVGVASALALLSLLTIASARGVAGRSRGLPTTWRGFLDVGLVAICALPPAFILEPLVHLSSITASAIAVFGAAMGAALVLRAARGSRVAIAGVCGATAAIIVVDLLLGGPLAERSALSYLIAEGARFHGIGNEMMGVLIGTVLIGSAAALDSSGAAYRRTAVIAVLGLTAGVMAAPQLGAKFGSIPASVPAFALLGLFIARVRLTVRSVIAVAVLTLLVAGGAIVADSLRNPEVQSHVGRAIGGGGDILGRKIGAAGRLLALSYWTFGIVLCGGSAIVLALRRSSLVARGLWGYPALRRALICCAVAAVAAVAANDAGVIAAAWLALLAASSFFALLLVPRDL